MAYLASLLADGERILVVERRHPLFLVGRALPFALAAIALVVAGIWIGTAVSGIAGTAVGIAALIPLAAGAIKVIAWRNERYVVTNYRIIQVEGILNRRVLDSSLEKVNDILLTQSLFGRLFNYGTLQILTGSDVGVNRLDSLGRPYDFKRAIVDARNRLSRDEDDGGGFDDPERLLAALTELRNSGLLSESEYRAKISRLPGSESVERSR